MSSVCNGTCDLWLVPNKHASHCYQLDFVYLETVRWRWHNARQRTSDDPKTNVHLRQIGKTFTTFIHSIQHCFQCVSISMSKRFVWKSFSNFTLFVALFAINRLRRSWSISNLKCDRIECDLYDVCKYRVWNRYAIKKSSVWTWLERSVHIGWKADDYFIDIAQFLRQF